MCGRACNVIQLRGKSICKEAVLGNNVQSMAAGNWATTEKATAWETRVREYSEEGNGRARADGRDFLMTLRAGIV
jgi:hypothetical protein